MSAKQAVLLINLGSPDSPSVPDVRRYLREFLMDKRVLDSPYLIRKAVVELFILPFRPKHSAHAYQKIWWKEGSPLVVISQRCQKALQQRLEVPVELAMRYGKPSIAGVLDSLIQKGVTEIILVPLYPHYAMSSYETVMVEVNDVLKKRNAKINLIAIPPFYKDELYVEALSESARGYLQDEYDLLLFSYHGLPERHMRLSDPTGRHCLQVENCCQVASEAHQYCYRHQVFDTTRHVAEKLILSPEKYAISFQSRLGRDPWLTPNTADEFLRLPASGVKRLKVICPSFVSDCLETLEEIQIAGKESFLSAGGESYEMIPCMNDNPAWIDVLEKWCLKELGVNSHISTR